MFRLRSRRRSFLIAVAVILSPILVVAAAAQSDLEQHLNDQYKNKTFMLRGFYSGRRLNYDSSGHAVNPPTAQDWTVAGVVRVEHISVSRERLKIDARRLHMGWLGAGFGEVHDQVGKFDRPEKEDRSLRIEADLGAATEVADAVVSQIFLTRVDSFADLVPDYWKPCVSAAVAGKADKPYSGCVFSPEFAAIPGISTPAAERPEPEEAVAGGAPLRNVRYGHGLTAPRVISQGDPEFSDEARRAKYQGITVLMLVVDKTGHVQNIRVAQPLGMGLDLRAVESVSTWRFDPASKNGEPVAVELAVEVDFHLY
jgi:TonB family protein